MSQTLKKAPTGGTKHLIDQPHSVPPLSPWPLCMPLSGTSFCVWGAPAFSIATSHAHEWLVHLEGPIHALTASDVYKRRRNWDGMDRQIATWASLPFDWDGEDGRAPSEDVVAAIREMVRRLRAASAPVPKAYVAGDGEVGLRWERADAYASASFIDDGHALLYMHVGSMVLHNVDELWSVDVDTAAFITDLAKIA